MTSLDVPLEPQQSRIQSPRHRAVAAAARSTLGVLLAFGALNALAGGSYTWMQPTTAVVALVILASVTMTTPASPSARGRRAGLDERRAPTPTVSRRPDR